MSESSNQTGVALGTREQPKEARKCLSCGEVITPENQCMLYSTCVWCMRDGYSPEFKRQFGIEERPRKKNISDSELLSFVPEEPTRASDILDSIRSAGYTVRRTTAKGRRNGTREGMVKALAQRLSNIPQVKNTTKPETNCMKYYHFHREGGQG